MRRVDEYKKSIGHIMEKVSDPKPLDNPILTILSPDPQPTTTKPKRFFKKALGKTRVCPGCKIEFTPARRNQLTCGKRYCVDRNYRLKNRKKLNAIERRKRRLANQEIFLQERLRSHMEADQEYDKEGRTDPEESRESPRSTVPFKLGKKGKADDMRAAIHQLYGEGGVELLRRLHDFAFGTEDIHPKLQLEALRELLDRGWGRPQQHVIAPPQTPLFISVGNQAAMFPDLGNPQVVALPPVENIGYEVGEVADTEENPSE